MFIFITGDEMSSKGVAGLLKLTTRLLQLLTGGHCTQWSECRHCASAQRKRSSTHHRGHTQWMRRYGFVCGIKYGHGRHRRECVVMNLKGLVSRSGIEIGQGKQRHHLYCPDLIELCNYSYV